MFWGLLVFGINIICELKNFSSLLKTTADQFAPPVSRDRELLGKGGLTSLLTVLL